MTPLEALAKARAAWEASHPQLPLDLWGEDGELGETARGGTAVSPSPPSPRTTAVPAKGGLDPEIRGVASVENSASYTDLDPGPEPRYDHERTGVPLARPWPHPHHLPPAGGSGPS